MAKLQVTRSFVPKFLIQHFRAGKYTSPCTYEEHFDHVVVGVADLSGFTKACESFTAYGPEGMELLSTVVNDCFGQIVLYISRYGGDIVKFAGDAIIAVWISQPGDPKPPNGTQSDYILCRALYCCTQMCTIFSQGSTFRMSTQRRTSSDRSTKALIAEANAAEFGEKMRLHCGVAEGPLDLFHVGGALGCFDYLVAGSALYEACKALDGAGKCELCVSKGVWDKIGAHCMGMEKEVEKPKGDGTMVTLIARLVIAIDSTSYCGISVSENMLMDEQPEENRGAKNIGGLVNASICSYIHKPVLAALKKTDSLKSFASMRQATTIFFNIAGPSATFCLYRDKGGENKDTDVPLQEIFVSLQDMVTSRGGVVRQFLVDDKGCIMIACWGVYSDAVIGLTKECLALDVALSGSNYLRNQQNIVPSIGVGSGLTYCGVTGSKRRREFAVVGHSVNLAARLMGKAKGRILSCEETYDKCTTTHEFADVEKVKLKNVKYATAVYPVKAALNARVEGDIIFRGREEEEFVQRPSVMAKCVKVLESDIGVIIVEGPPGSGKSSVLKMIANHARSLGHTVHANTCVESENSTPYSVLRRVFRACLGLNSDHFEAMDTRSKINYITFQLGDLKDRTSESGIVSPRGERKGGSFKRLNKKSIGVTEVRKETMGKSPPTKLNSFSVPKGEKIDDSTSDVIAAGNTSSSSEDIPTFASQLATGKQRLLASFPLLKVFENNEHAKAMPEKFNEQSDEQSASVLPKATKNLGFDIIMGSGKRIILCIDNIEFIDYYSMSLLSALANEPRCTIFAACQRTEHRNIKVLLQRSQKAEILTLEPFDEKSIRDLIQKVCGSKDVSDHLLKTVYDFSKGNPLWSKVIVEFLLSTEVIKVEASGEVLVNEKALSEMQEQSEEEWSMKQLIVKQFDALPKEQREVLNVAAIIDDEFSLDLLHHLLPEKMKEQGLSSTLTQLTQLSELGFLASTVQLVESIDSSGQQKQSSLAPGVASASTTYYVASVTTSKIIYNMMSRVYKQDLHLKLANYYESAEYGEVSTMYPVLAHHLLRAEQFGKAGRMFEMAAYQASRDGYMLKGVEYMSHLHELSHNPDFDFQEYDDTCRDVNMQILRWEVETANFFLYAGLHGPASQVQTQAAERFQLIQDKKATAANLSKGSSSTSSAKVAPMAAVLAEMPKPMMLRPWTPSVRMKDRSVSEDFTGDGTATESQHQAAASRIISGAKPISPRVTSGTSSTADSADESARFREARVRSYYSSPRGSISMKQAQADAVVYLSRVLTTVVLYDDIVSSEDEGGGDEAKGSTESSDVIMEDSAPVGDAPVKIKTFKQMQADIENAKTNENGDGGGESANVESANAAVSERGSVHDSTDAAAVDIGNGNDNGNGLRGASNQSAFSSVSGSKGRASESQMLPSFSKDGKSTRSDNETAETAREEGNLAEQDSNSQTNGDAGGSRPATMKCQVSAGSVRDGGNAGNESPALEKIPSQRAQDGGKPANSGRGGVGGGGGGDSGGGGCCLIV